MTKRPLTSLLGTTLAAAILALLWTAGPATADRASDLREWGAKSRSALLADPGRPDRRAPSCRAAPGGHAGRTAAACARPRRS